MSEPHVMTTIATQMSLPEPIRSYVARFVRLHRRHAVLRAAGVAAALTIGWMLMCCALDRAWPLPPVVRLVLLCVNLVMVAAVLLGPMSRWVRRDIDFRAAADEIEQRDGRFAERLQTVTSQLLSPPSQRGSALLLASMAGELNAELGADHPGRLLPGRPLLRPWMAAAVLAMIAGGLTLIPSYGLPSLLARYAAPFAPVPPPTTTKLIIEPRGIDLIEGQTITIEAIVQRGGGGGATLHYRKASQPWAELAMRPSRAERFDAVLGPVDSDIRYYITAGDARSETYAVRVVKRPIVREFRIGYVYPAYLNRPPTTAVNTDGFVEAPVGTEANITIVASEPLASASLSFGDRTLALTRGEQPEMFRGSFTIQRSTSYSLEMISTSNVAGAGDTAMRISALSDAKPVVELNRPERPLRLRPRDVIWLDFEAGDDNGIAAMAVRATQTPRHIDFSGAQPDLALRRPTTQSSTALGAGADRAVDGDVSGDFHAGSVTHTELEPAPWWQVDLGAVHDVSRVQIWNRSDAVPERLSEFVVFAGEQPPGSGDPATLRKQPAVAAIDIEPVAGRPTSIDLFRPVRYLRVQLLRQEYLSLAEVRVLGFRPPTTNAATTVEATIPISGNARRQRRTIDLNLAALGARLGDTVTLSIIATDTAGQETLSAPISIHVMPHGFEPATVARSEMLRRAAATADEIARALEQAIGQSSTTQPATAPVVGVGRSIVRAAEQASSLQPVLLEALAAGLAGGAADAVAATLDDTVTIAAAGDEVYRSLGIENVPAPADLKRLGRALEQARRAAARLATIADAERAVALLADVRNVAALNEAFPHAIEHLQALRDAREEVRSEVAAQLRLAGLDPAAPELAARLSAQIRAVDNPVPPVAFSVGANFPARIALAARAEALRVDGDEIRLHDLRTAAARAATEAESTRRLLDTVQAHHAVRRQRSRGGMVLVRGLWADAVSRAARARLGSLQPPAMRPPAAVRLDRVRAEQASLLDAVLQRSADAARLATRQQEIAATMERLVLAEHPLIWEGRSSADTRIDAVRVATAATRDIQATEETAGALLRALEPYQPETIETMRVIEEALRPAAHSKDPDEITAAVEQVRLALEAALQALVEEDALLAAYAAAHRAAIALDGDASKIEHAVAEQRRAIAALREAADRAAREAARTAPAAGAPAGSARLPAAASATPPAGAARASPAATGPVSPPPQVHGYDDALNAYYKAITAPETPPKPAAP
jgi:hypothetical protein